MDRTAARTEMQALSSPEPRPWPLAVAWLVFLGSFFFITYGGANAIAARRHDVPSIVFDWERLIPFLGWSIIPYSSIDVFYICSFFICSTETELTAHARRLLTAQSVAVVFFVLLPLRFTFEQPATEGVAGVLFAALNRFDRPYNQAPSLHIAVLVVLWHLYSSHMPKQARWLLHVWFALVGASVLTTYQHHFFDIPTGAALGLCSIWLWPSSHAARSLKSKS